MIASDLEAKSYAATKNIKEMESVGSTPKVNIIVETGGGSNQTTIDGKRFIDFTKVQRYLVLHNSIQNMANLGKKDMANPKTLSDFIVWGMSNFPAKKYAIILWDHGSGINGFGADFVFNNDKLTLDGMNQAFANASKITNKKFELIGFDSCLMASVEVANSLKSFGNYMVSSEEIEPSWGWDYSSVLASLIMYPYQNGASLGKTIADSFFEKSKSLSLSQEYNAYSEITMSVINLTKVSPIINSLNKLADYLDSQMTNFTLYFSLTKSIDFSEGYGKTSNGGSGLVDIYDLASNIKEQFPQSAYIIDAIDKSLDNAIAYKINGNANPNSHGLSIYLPIIQQEFKEARKYALDRWQKIINFEYNLTKYDHNRPYVHTELVGDTIKGHVSENNIQNVTLWIYTTSMPEGKAAFYQEIDPSSFIKNDGSFQFKWSKQILSLCNGKQHACMPTSMNIESNRDKRFVLIPVRLQSNKNNINESVSLKYELNKEGNNNFTLLGARPEIKATGQQQQVVPKENWPINTNDVIYPIRYSFDSEDQNIADLKKVEGTPIKVADSFKPKYVNYNGTFDIDFRICAYSNICLYTRWFHFPATPKTYAEAVDLSGYNITTCSRNDNISNFSTYENPIYEFKIQYPSSWKYDQDQLQDNTVAEFGTQGQNDFILLLTYVGYWPGSYKEFLDDITPSNDTNQFTKTIEFSSTTLDRHPAYKTVYISKALGLESDHEQIWIESLVGHTIYDIIISFPPSQLDMYLPTIEKVLGSFHICKSKEMGIDEISHSTQTTREQLNSTKNLHSNVSKALNFSKPHSYQLYIDPSFRFKIQYPSNISYTTYRNQFNENTFKNMTNTFFDFLPLIEIANPFVYHAYIDNVLFTLSVSTRV